MLLLRLPLLLERNHSLRLLLMLARERLAVGDQSSTPGGSHVTTSTFNAKQVLHRPGPCRPAGCFCGSFPSQLLAVWYKSLRLERGGMVWLLHPSSPSATASTRHSVEVSGHIERRSSVEARTGGGSVELVTTATAVGDGRLEGISVIQHPGLDSAWGQITSTSASAYASNSGSGSGSVWLELLGIVSSEVGWKVVLLLMMMLLLCGYLVRPTRITGRSDAEMLLLLLTRHLERKLAERVSRTRLTIIPPSERVVRHSPYQAAAPLLGVPQSNRVLE